MDKLKVFENQNFGQVRIISDASGEPWFVAKDVAKILEIQNIRQNLSELDEDEKGVCNVYTPGGEQEMSTISESGLYSLVFRSRKPEAKAFSKWVRSEVIPSIRKHGAYLTPAKIKEALLNPDMIIELATKLKSEQEKSEQLQSRIDADRPKVVFAESIEVAKTSILIGEMAKLIKQATGLDIGQNRFFDWLRNRGYLHKHGCQRNMPTQRCIDAGWMEIKEGTRMGTSGECHITRTAKITGKGQIYFINLFMSKGTVAA